MKYRLEGTTIEAIDTYVRVTLGNGKCAVTKNETPSAEEVALLLSDLQGYWPNSAQLMACSRAARDSRDNVIELAI